MNAEILDNEIGKRKQRPTLEVECYSCKNKFTKYIHHHKYSIKHEQKEFCGKECQNRYKNTSVTVKCSFCSKDVIVSNGYFESRVNKHFFCGSSCSASFNNKLRGSLSDKTKNKIKDSINSYYLNLGISRRSICPVCDREFNLSSRKCVCCSKKCGTIYKFGMSPLSKDDVVNSIINYFSENHLTPCKREFKGTMFYAATKFFGSWNKAVENCGLVPNLNSPRNIRIKCRDGHVVRSISEKVIDNWFSINEVRHDLEKPYKEGRYTCDFYLPDYDIWIEYFGLAGAFKEYDDAILTKKEMVKKYNLNFIPVFPEDLYPVLNLDKVIGTKLKM